METTAYERPEDQPHSDKSESDEHSEEARVAKQARRAEQPEPDAAKPAPATGSASRDIVNNTGDDADTSDADAATG